MPNIKKEEIKALKAKYQAMINSEFSIDKDEKLQKPIYSREYKQFKKELYPKNLSIYEKLCNISEKILPFFKPDKKTQNKLLENINTCHLNITPTGVMSFSILTAFLTVIIGSVVGFVIPYLMGQESYFFILFFLLLAGVLLMVLPKIPDYLATRWRMKSSNQIVLSIFYVVAYMRHTSNLEGAIRFAADHLSVPLSLDFKKILWDVETEKFSSVRESLDYFLEKWKKHDIEYVESFHLIEGSLFESTETRRLSLLDKSLEVMLEGTYEKMLHFAHNLNSPITTLHMLGVILPVLGLVILPLIVSFMTPPLGPPTDAGGTAPLLLALYLATFYNISLPLIVFFMGQNILSKRPAGYGDIDISNNPELKKYSKLNINLGAFKIRINPMVIAIMIFLLLFMIGISPILINNFASQVETPDGKTISSFETFGIMAPKKIDTNIDSNFYCNKIFCLLDYKEVAGKQEGPYGSLSSLLSIFIVLAVGISFGVYYKLKSSNVMKIRRRAKELEKEFASAMFQLGNRLADGYPAEIAFGKVASTMQDTVSGRFMNQVSENITRLGMSVEKAIFDKKHGALVYFPSNIIESSMKVLVQSIKKGPKVAAQSLVSISQYIKEIHKVDERLKDLLSDVVSSMRSQVNFLAPTIAGIVIGISSMISVIISKLSGIIPKQVGAETGPQAQGFGGILDLLGAGVPTYYFQIIVGIYVIQLVFILTVLINNILNGSDKLNEKYLKGKNIIKGTIIYCFISFGLMFLFNIIAANIIKPAG